MLGLIRFRVSVSVTGPNAPMIFPATKCQIAFFPLASAAHLKWIADHVLATINPATHISSTPTLMPLNMPIFRGLSRGVDGPSGRAWVGLQRVTPAAE